MSFTTLKWHHFTLQYLQYCQPQVQRILIFVGHLFWNSLRNLVRMAWDLTNFKCNPQRKSTGKSPSMAKLDWSLVAIQESEKCLYFYCGNQIRLRSVNFKRTLWCHGFDQKSNDFFKRISALASKKSSNEKTLLYNHVTKCLYFFDLTPFKRLGQKSLKKICCFFGRNDDIKCSIRWIVKILKN